VDRERTWLKELVKALFSEDLDTGRLPSKLLLLRRLQKPALHPTTQLAPLAQSLDPIPLMYRRSGATDHAERSIREVVSVGVAPLVRRNNF